MGSASAALLLGVCLKACWYFLTEWSSLPYRVGDVGGAALSLFSDEERRSTPRRPLCTSPVLKGDKRWRDQKPAPYMAAGAGF